MNNNFLKLCIGILLLTFVVNSSEGQSSIHSFGLDYDENVVNILDYNETDFSTIALSVQLGESDRVVIDYRLDDQQYTRLHADEHVNNKEGYWISELLFIPKGVETISIKIVEGELPRQVYLRQFAARKASSHYKEHKTEPKSSATLRTDCECDKPTMLDRDEWCNNGCPKDYEPYITDVTHLMIHHSAGSNSSSDWAAVVESYWDFHVNTRGWDDIGYNWLIDPDGKIYIGRGEDVRGAHFCAKNTGSMGICMVGTFTDVEPTTQALDALKTLLAWKTCKNGINPTGTSFYAASGKNLHNITGHRSDCATTCPGDQLWNLLPQIRNSVQAYIETECSDIQEITLSGIYKEEENRIELTWNSTFLATEKFVISRKTKFGAFEVYDSTEFNFPQYIDRNIVSGETYTYTVRSLYNSNSIMSNQVAVTVPANYEPTLYPTLAQESIVPDMRLDTETVFSYHIYNVQGRLMEKGRFTSGINAFQKQIDVSRYSAGQYYLNLESEKSKQTFKFQKLN